MDCTKCTFKGCRNSYPCQDNSDKYVGNYLLPENQLKARAASLLIDNGRAGSLSRLEEIVEYMKIQGYTRIGCAYCYGMEKEAALLGEYLTAAGFKPTMVSCTVDQVMESVIDTDKTNQVVSCNPLGQAYLLNSSGVSFTILMGLCLGHDILIQKNLNMDFTTFVVKDRVYKNNPILGLPGLSF